MSSLNTPISFTPSERDEKMMSQALGCPTDQQEKSLPSVPTSNEPQAVQWLIAKPVVDIGNQ